MAQSALHATQTWQPQKYLKFQKQRLRPALDLLARVASLPSGADDSIEIIDLGAGTGSMAPAFLNRWPNAHVTFVDSAASMLEVAQCQHKETDSLDTQQFTYVQADFETYDPEHPVDLIFSNAALQWARADRHMDIMSRLYSFLKPEGVLAFQIPDTRLQPNYHLMVQAAAELGLRQACAPSRASTTRSSTTTYSSPPTTTSSSTCGSPCTRTYSRATTPSPVHESSGQNVDRSLAARGKYRELVAAAYPKQSDGSAVFNFKRFFLTATKPL